MKERKIVNKVVGKENERKKERKKENGNGNVFIEHVLFLVDQVVLGLNPCLRNT